MQYLSRGSISKFAAINLICLFWCNLQIIVDGLSYIRSELTQDNIYENLKVNTVDTV